MSLPISGDRSTPEHVWKGDKLPTCTEFASDEKDGTKFGREKPGYKGLKQKYRILLYRIQNYVFFDGSSYIEC